MAQAARGSRLAGLPRSAGAVRPRLGLTVRIRETLRLSVEQARQRRELAGYTALQDVGRQTGTRG